MTSPQPATTGPAGRDARPPATTAATVGRQGPRRLPGAGMVLGLLLLAGAAVRIWGIDFGLPHTQARPDETQVMDVALTYLRGTLWPKFFDYPRLYTYAVLAAFLAYYAGGRIAGTFASLAAFVATWPVNWEPFFLINRSLSAAAGILVIPVACAMGRRLGDAGTGLVAALFMALAYGHVRDSHFGTTDTTLVLLCAACALWLLKSDARRWGRADVAAAAFAGLAAATKYNGVILLVPLGLSHLIYAGQQPARRVAALVGGRALAIGAAFALAFAVGVPFILFDYTRFSNAMGDLSTVLSIGFTPANRTNGWWYHLAVSLRHGLGLPLLACGLAGFAVVARRDWRTGLLLLSFPAAYFAVAGSFGLQFVRYALPIVPFLCVSAAVTITAMTRQVASPRWRATLTAAAALAVVWPSASSVVDFDKVIGRTDSRVLAAEWMARHAEPGASILVSGSRYGYPQFDRVFRAWRWDRDLLAFVEGGRRAEGQPDWIVVQESPLPNTTQPQVIELLQSGYDRLSMINAFEPAETRNLYDRQDAFFLPFAGFDGVRRPGPNFVIYKHPSARWLPGPDTRR